MRLLIIRHADPDYVHDSLTPTGHEEATYLAAYLRDVTIDHAYVSPMGRAQLTAAYTLADQGMGATTLEWLHEFGPNIRKPSSMLVPGCAWDWLPEDWTQREIFYTEKWYEEPTMQKYGVGEEYLRVCACFDELLAQHGYRRAGKIYQVEQANHDTIALFCHYGLGCVLLSHLMSVSPMILWHGLCAAPSSITTVYTEERRRGKASFRVTSYGAIPHLVLAGAEPSFGARFCECYEDDTRH